MTTYLLAGPAEEPVSLAEARAFLRVDDTAEDELIATLIAAARIHVESVTSRALLSQSWRLALEEWPASGAVGFPITPVLQLVAVRYFGALGEPHEIDLAEVTTDLAAGRAFLPAAPTLVSAPLRRQHEVELDFTAGFGESADDVPADLRQAMLMLVAYWFEHRDAVVVAGSGSIVPGGFDQLVARYRRVRL